MAQEPPQPNIIAAGHIAVAGGGSKATERLLHDTCLTWPPSSPIRKKGIFPCPCQGVGSGRKQQLYSRNEKWWGYKIRRFLYVNICHSATAPAPSSVPMCPRQKGTIDNHPTPAIIYSLEHCPQAPSAEAKATELCKLMHQLAPWPTLGSKANLEGYHFQFKIWNSNVPIHSFLFFNSVIEHQSSFACKLLRWHL